MTEQSTGGQVSMFDQDSWFGKMSPELLVPTTERISESFSKKRVESQTVQPQFLDLRTGGLIAESSWETDSPWFGQFTPQSIGAYPKEERGSLLSQILEDRPHPKYCLSAKACQGILNRAAKRGKELPKILKEALEQSVSKNVQGVTGGVKDSSFKQNEPGLSQPSTTKPSCVSSEPLILKDVSFLDVDEGGCAWTLRARDYKNPQVVTTFSQDAYDEYSETDSSSTLRASGGIYGGGSESLVIQ